MLRRERVAGGDAFLHVRNHNHAAVPERSTSNVRGGQIGELAPQLRVDAIGKSGIERDEHRHRVGIMLGLREQIGRDDCRRSGGVGEDNELRWAGEHIDGDASRDELLRRRDVAVSGADDHVTGSQGAGGGAECERRDGMGSTRRQHTLGAGDGGSGERHRSGLRARDPDLLHTGRSRRHRGHQDRRWQGIAAAGRVASGALERSDPVPGRPARHCDRHITQRAFLGLGEQTDPLRDALQARAVARRQARECAIESGPVQEQRAPPARRDLGESLSVLPQRGFTAGSHRFHDRRGNSEGLGGHGGSATTHQFGDGATTQHAGVFLAIGRLLTAP